MEYDEDFLQEIASNVDLVEYVSKDIELKRNGKDYFGRCPKHIDKTPSFSITPEKNSFYCFGCGRGGGIIGYMQEYEGLSFDDAVAKASRLANIDSSQMCNSPTVRFLKKMRKLKQKSEPVKHRILPESEYEKFTKEPVEEWLNEGIRSKELDLFNIRIDKRGNRIVYPVRSIGGELINIKGRTRFKDYKDLRLAKYINYYEVGTMDYLQSLDLSLPYIKECGEIIIFEGIKSVMKCFGWGYKNCVSAEKHSLTNEQIRLLVSLRVDVVLAFDSDVSYREKDVISSINKLKRFTNVYLIEDDGSLGGAEGKCSPADKGVKVFEKLYANKRKVR